MTTVNFGRTRHDKSRDDAADDTGAAQAPAEPAAPPPAAADGRADGIPAPDRAGPARADTAGAAATPAAAPAGAPEGRSGSPTADGRTGSAPAGRGPADATVPPEDSGADLRASAGKADTPKGAAAGSAGTAQAGTAGAPDAGTAGTAHTVHAKASSPLADGSEAPDHRRDQAPGEASARGGAAAPAPAQELDRLSRRMERAVGGFVDDPRRAVKEADAVLEETTQRLTRLLTERRTALRKGWDGAGSSAGTEELRVALTHYRDMTRDLLNVDLGR